MSEIEAREGRPAGAAAPTSSLRRLVAETAVAAQRRVVAMRRSSAFAADQWRANAAH
jgi:hypothetical protein